MTNPRRIDFFGLLCLGTAALAWLPSLWLRCPQQAAVIGGFSLLDGFVFGCALALITRTRRPILIYCYLGVVVLTFVPLFQSWPPGGPWDVTLPPGTPDILLNYLDMLRIGLFLLGFPYPFARFGQHGPDLLPEEMSAS